jgi:hypothetical protein
LVVPLRQEWVESSGRYAVAYTWLSILDYLLGESTLSNPSKASAGFLFHGLTGALGLETSKNTPQLREI